MKGTSLLRRDRIQLPRTLEDQLGIEVRPAPAHRDASATWPLSSIAARPLLTKP